MKTSIFTPHSTKQEEAIFSEKDITLCLTGLQWGKGLYNNNYVLTPTGYRKVKDIKVGDVLFDRNGEKTKVMGVFPQGKKRAYRITTTDGKELITDSSHINIIIPRHGRDEILMTTRELFSRVDLWSKSTRARIPSLSAPINFSEKELYISPYALGCLIGDGGLTSGVNLTNIDKDLIGRFIKELPNGFNLTLSNKITYRVTSSERTKEGYGKNSITDELRSIGLYGLKSHEKFIPDKYKYSSIGQRLDLLRGLMDTDGWVAKNKAIEFTTTSKLLANDIVYLIESLAAKAWINEKIPKLKGVKYKKCYMVRFILKSFNPFYIKRKADKYFIHENTQDKIIKSVEKLAYRETTCFKVDSLTSSFIAQGQIVTHNTTVGARWLLAQVFKYAFPEANFIITAPTYKIMNQSTLPEFLKVFEPYGEFRRGDMEFKLNWGSTIYLRTGTDPDSVVGVTNVYAIWGDEAGKYGLYFWQNIEGRAALKDAPIMLTTTPYSLNWLYKELVKPYYEEKRDDCLLISAKSIENPYFSKKTYYKRKQTMDPRMFRAMYEGTFERLAGTVYDCFTEHGNIQKQIAPEVLNQMTFYGGIDWGYTDPFVLLIMGVTPNGDRFIVSEFYKTNQTPDMIVEMLTAKMSYFPMKLVWCDPSRPDMIAMLSERRFPVTKANNDIMAGIGEVYDCFKNEKLKVLEDSAPNLLDEIEMYHYPEPKDLMPDQDSKKEKPVDQYNHAMDALRYLTMGVKHMVTHNQPQTNVYEIRPRQQEQPHEQVARIRRPSRRRSEVWS